MRDGNWSDETRILQKLERWPIRDRDGDQGNTYKYTCIILSSYTLPIRIYSTYVPSTTLGALSQTGRCRFPPSLSPPKGLPKLRLDRRASSTTINSCCRKKIRFLQRTSISLIHILPLLEQGKSLKGGNFDRLAPANSRIAILPRDENGQKGS